MSAELDAVAAKLVVHEGFRGDPYDDSLGRPTIGFGTLLPLTRDEAYWLLRHRLGEKVAELDQRIPWWRGLPTPVCNAMAGMAYQLGVNGLLGFRKTLALLQAGKYAEAADEAMRSRWATQTASRAKEVTDMIRKGG